MPRLDKKKIVALLLEEEEEEEEAILNIFYQNKEEDAMFKNRSTDGAYAILIRKHLFFNDEKFRQYFRFSIELFKELYNIVECDISCRAYNRRMRPISKEEKLCLTLRYLATGESFRSLAFNFRISHSWIGRIVEEVFDSIIKNAMPHFLPEPNKQIFEDAEKEFAKLWNFPNCCGAIDGKHVRIVCPPNSGSAYFNYKDFFSTVLLALVDANYCFLSVDVGSYGKEGDSSIFQESNLRKNMQSGLIKLPEPKYLPHSKILCPHVFVGDAAFALTCNMMKPFPEPQALQDEVKSTYNYRLCRARRTSENAFAILCQFFRVFFTPISCKITTVRKLILASCILYNMLRRRDVAWPKENLELPKKNLQNLAASNSNHASFKAEFVRQNFAKYFSSKAGTLKWQKKHVIRNTN